MTQTTAGYQISEMIHEGATSRVYRGVRQADKRRVILKMLNQAYPSPEKVARFKLEYETIRALHQAQTGQEISQNVVQAYDLLTSQDQWLIVLEDFGGESLDQIIQRKPLTVGEFLPMAIQLVNSLGAIHRQQVIHKDINPSNVVFNPQTGELKLIDFGLATRLKQETPALREPHLLEGTLAYIAPEQTGRMNRAVDYRSDYYALGVTFYQLLVHQLPFTSADALALVHSHIAQAPVPPHERNAAVPPTLSAIVMKLLAKNAEERYQSAHGLLHDLTECWRQWQANQRVEPWPLAQSDVSGRLQPSQKLYGREAEIQTLHAAFARVSEGASEVLMVAGYTGIGKSALVQEIYRPMTQRRGYFVAGKFDQFQRDIPYAPLVQAFQTLARQLLAESEQALGQWRERLQAALGANGRVITDVIPEVALIIGAQPELPMLAPAEAQNRFNLVMGNFIRVFAQAEHPLILFMDDLQWADVASLKLLELLITARDSGYLLLLGAYRSNEVKDAHPLVATLHVINAGGRAVQQMTLGPLALADVAHFLADTLSSSQNLEPLTELVLAKTAGNPFFIIEFLKSLYTKQLITFDFQAIAWRWNMAAIQQSEITANVADLMREKVSRLSQATQQVVKLAALIGNQFDLHTLAIACQKTPQATAAALWEALTEGIILPLSDAYRVIGLDVQGLAEALNVTYKFAHDQLQAAAYALIPAAEQPDLHWQVGQFLYRQIAPAEREYKVFDIVNQLNAGRTQAQDQADRLRLAELNLQAGKRAKAAAAYQSAFYYLQSGLDVLLDASWTEEYDLMLALHLEAAESAYLTTNFGEMERLAALILQRARTVLDKVSIYEVKIRACMARHQLLEAVQTGLAGLELLGVHFPRKPGKAHALLGFAGTKVTLAGKKIAQLGQLPAMSDPIQLASMRILGTMGAVTFIAAPDLFPLTVFKQVNFSVKYGNTIESAFAYALYGISLCGIVGDMEAGYQFGQLALYLLDQFNAKKLKAKTWMAVYHFIVPWREPLRGTVQPLREAQYSGIETGDLEFATHAANVHDSALFYAGSALAPLERQLVASGELIAGLKQERALNFQKLNRQIVLNLLGRAENPLQMIGESCDETKLLPLLRAAHDANSLGQFFLFKLLLCYLFHDYAGALDNSAHLQAHLPGMLGTFYVAVYNFYDSLARLAHLPHIPSVEQKAMYKRVAANQKKLKKWADNAPSNYLHKFWLVEAELARTRKQDEHAPRYYDQAIDLARQNEYGNEEALANELAGQFYLARSHERLAHHYLRDAHYAYQRWGAVAKVKDLEQRYPQLLLRTAPSTRQTTITTTTTSTGQTSAVLDLTSVFKASQAISGEIQLDRLLDKLMTVVIENAGAQRGFLLLERKGQWWIEAEGLLEKTPVAAGSPAATTLQAMPTADSDQLSAAIVNYVARTRENVVLDDAAQAGLFTQDAYVRRAQPKSVLCAPLLNQGKLTGILYLENNLTTGTFTPDRLEVLNLLSAQAAISIENARLYNNLTASEQRFRTLFENAPLGVFEIDLGPTVPTILAANRQAEQVYGWSAVEFAAMPVEQLVPPEAVLQLRQMVNSVQSGKTATIETSGLRRRGVVFAARISATPQSGPGWNHLIVTVEDITLEKQRQAEIEAIEAERRRIAHEIHDGLAQDLAALRFKTTLWHDLVDKNPAHMHGELDQLMEILNESIREVRRSIFALRPIALDELGFFPALRQFSANFGEQYQLRIKLAVLGAEERLPAALELPLFRVIQEALNNIRKHAQAHNVQICLDLAHPQTLSLTIHDDGKGFDLANRPRMFKEGHVGLKQMEERIKNINGAFSLHSQVGQGTTIEVTLDLSEPLARSDA